jgi:hypothetical protein
MDPSTVLYSLFGPFLVWPIEYFLPYPFIIEELFKVLVVWFGPRKAKVYLLAGILFATTETVLYTINVNITGTVTYMFLRFASTSILHSTTFLIIYYFTRQNKKLIIFGFIISALFHYLYNNFIPSF